LYLSLTPKGEHLLVANYISGVVAVFPVDASGKLSEASNSQQDAGPAGAGKPAAAAEGSFAISDHNGPHAHMIATDPSGKFAFSTDLGLDRIYQWKLNGESGALEANDPPFIKASSEGAGPRHFVFHPNGHVIFLINEEASTLTSYRFDAAKGTLTELHSLSSLPAGFKGTNFAAGIVLSKDGKHLYVANRLHNSIAQIAVTGEGAMTWSGETWTRGDYPRTLTLSPDGKYIYAMNQRSDNITTFKVSPDSGKLTFVDSYVAVGSPSQMVIAP
ncbi:lactonase family protein, partial [Enterobacteriaceae bacterium ML5]